MFHDLTRNHYQIPWFSMKCKYFLKFHNIPEIPWPLPQQLPNITSTNCTVAEQSWNCGYPASFSMHSALPTDRLNVWAAKFTFIFWLLKSLCFLVTLKQNRHFVMPYITSMNAGTLRLLLPLVLTNDLFVSKSVAYFFALPRFRQKSLRFTIWWWEFDSQQSLFLSRPCSLHVGSLSLGLHLGLMCSSSSLLQQSSKWDCMPV